MPVRGVPLEIGRGRVLREGSTIAILSFGTRLAECLKAAVELAARGLSAKDLLEGKPNLEEAARLETLSLDASGVAAFRTQGGVQPVANVAALTAPRQVAAAGTAANTANTANAGNASATPAGSNAPAGAAISTSGVITWTPTEAQGPSNYTFAVIVSDGVTNVLETIQVQVNEVNLAPVLAPLDKLAACVKALPAGAEIELAPAKTAL
jgi:hypothetical protein